MSQQPHEFELKVALTQDEFDRLVANPKLKGGRKPLKRTLRSVYYDTPDHRLHDEGLTLRVRADGEGFVQTVKTASGVELGLSNPVEVEDQIVGSEPDVSCINNKHIRRKVEDAVGASALTPVFETDVTRTTYRLRRSGSVIEVSLDEGEARAEDRSSSICEAELELISGDPKALLETAQALFSGAELHLSPASKAERGYRLLLDMPEGKELERRRNSSAVQQSHLPQRLPSHIRVYWMSEELVHLMDARREFPSAAQAFEDPLPFIVRCLGKLAETSRAGWRRGARLRGPAGQSCLPSSADVDVPLSVLEPLQGDAGCRPSAVIPT